MKALLTLPLLTLALPLQPILAESIGHWRFDEPGAAAGSPISVTPNNASPGTLDAQSNLGSPLYSDDVPSISILDPITGQSYPNGFSFDASGANAQLAIPDADALDRSFTVEFFIKMIGEPASYESVLRRREFADLNWQIDFDHGANRAFGRSRCRWDTPAGAPDGTAENGVDENYNFVLGPRGNGDAPKVYVDTGAKDALGADVGPQNTGRPQDYVYDPASANPNETDVALQGDGINDDPDWHHIAMSFDQDSGEIRFYFDYQLMQTRTLSDSEGDGYTHPAAAIAFGKLSATNNGLLLDELRYSSGLLTPGDFLRDATSGAADVIGHWRMENDSANAGDGVTGIENSASPLHPAALNNGSPSYSADVPGSTILDPVRLESYPNRFSLDVSAANSSLSIADDDAFDSDFTFEMFIKIGGEPGGYHSFVRRREANDLRWQIDFDHGAKTSFGRMRSRFDTPAGLPDNVNEAGVDENINFVVGPTGGASIPGDRRIWVDTDPGDGDPANYDDAADWANDGDGLNDAPGWHHVALSFDQAAGSISFYYDYELMQTRTLSDSQGDGYTHPAGDLLIGKLVNAGYAMWIDEVRYSSRELLPFEFLQVVAEPQAPLEITGFDYDTETGEASISWNSVPGRAYSVDRSGDLSGIWFEQLEAEIASEGSMTFTDPDIPPGTRRAYYRVREVPPN